MCRLKKKKNLAKKRGKKNFTICHFRSHRSTGPDPDRESHQPEPTPPVMARGPPRVSRLPEKRQYNIVHSTYVSDKVSVRLVFAAVITGTVFTGSNLVGPNGRRGSQVRPNWGCHTAQERYEFGEQSLQTAKTARLPFLRDRKSHTNKI